MIRSFIILLCGIEQRDDEYDKDQKWKKEHGS